MQCDNDSLHWRQHKYLCTNSTLSNYKSPNHNPASSINFNNCCVVIVEWYDWFEWLNHRGVCSRNGNVSGWGRVKVEFADGDYRQWNWISINNSTQNDSFITSKTIRWCFFCLVIIKELGRERWNDWLLCLCSWCSSQIWCPTEWYSGECRYQQTTPTSNVYA